MKDFTEIYRRKFARQYLQLSLEQFPALQNAVELLASIFHVPIALITFLDKDIQYITNKVGVDLTEMPRKTSFCTHAITQEHPLVVPDTLTDDRFSRLPVVVEPPRVRFYAGKAIHNEDGYRVGTVCVFDTKPVQPTEHQLKLLDLIARQVENLLAFRLESEKQNQVKLALELNNEDLRKQTLEVKAQLSEALDSVGKVIHEEVNEQDPADPLFALYQSVKKASFSV